MKKLIMKYGLIAGVVVVCIPFIGSLVMGSDPSTYQMGEIIGYSTMIFSLLTIFLAVKEYKVQCNEVVSFKQIFLLGIGITFIAAFMFGVYNVLYATVIEPDFMNNYFNYYIENIRNSGATEEVINQQIAQLEQEKSFFMNPLVNFSVMFASVFMIGLIISVVFAFSQSERKRAS
ncbi:DUF4199 domain-containing protein [Thalassotalea sp. 1_MG-2023]|uniref:DUF4199 domain-containing protein n=1 Tax=Thalassotalea sp. 1_MG-2023 TaxID=3062680 RepID=UPI0026E19A28|nr:DUF4199 domain-containing protein [Thalassotalea sp. 1_MG-2023]MDO6428792.1 DUF4199 domain-containing protein [Thalassotalea sp. 1_MG-2023]